MNFNYMFITKLKEIAQNKRMTFIIIICLVLGYIFILVFSSKLYEINRRLSLTEMENIENAWISSRFDKLEIFNTPDAKAGIVHRTDYRNTVVYFTFKDEIYTTFAVEADKDLSYHYKLEGFSDDIFMNIKSNKQVMVSEFLANKYHMTVGDEIIVKGVVWHINAIVTCEHFRRMIIFPKDSGIEQSDGYSSQGTIIQFSESFLNSRADVLELLKTSFTSLQQKQQYTRESLHSYALFLVGFALLFISLSILNCYLVFYANINYKRKIYGIKKAYGASISNCFRDIFLENSIFSLLAFHIACFLVNEFRYNIPEFFYTEVTLSIYVSGMLVVFIINILYSLMIFKKINRESTIKLLKE